MSYKNSQSWNRRRGSGYPPKKVTLHAQITYSNSLFLDNKNLNTLELIIVHVFLTHIFEHLNLVTENLEANKSLSF